jgi:hypothetical protein
MRFELQPTLTGTLLDLRPLRDADFDELYAVASDPRIWELHPEPDRYKEDVFNVFFRGAMDSAEPLPSSIGKPAASSGRPAITATTRSGARSRLAGRSSRQPTGAASTTAT